MSSIGTKLKLGADLQTIPTYRVLNEEGRPVKGGTLPELTKDEALRMYKTMALVPVVDNILYQSQRQGRISFYMQCSGEEAAVVGSAAAMQDSDEVFGQYVSSLYICSYRFWGRAEQMK